MATSSLYHFTVSTPAGTTEAAPQTSALTIPAMQLARASVRIPPGHNGQVGFQLWLGGGQVLPINAGAWFIGSGELVEVDTDELPETGAWELVSYNTGMYAHVLIVRFLAEPVGGTFRPPAASPVGLTWPSRVA